MSADVPAPVLTLTPEVVLQNGVGTLTCNWDTATYPVQEWIWVKEGQHLSQVNLPVFIAQFPDADPKEYLVSHLLT